VNESFKNENAEEIEMAMQVHVKIVIEEIPKEGEYGKRTNHKSIRNFAFIEQ